MSAPGRIDVVFGQDYLASGLPHFARLGLAFEAARRSGLVRAHEPQSLPLDALRGLHDDAYLDAMRDGLHPLARSSYLPWSPELVSSCLAMLGGQQLGAEIAMREGRAVNIACGFHHAHPECGGGFCVFNGMALLAHLHPGLRISVLDCDEHGGDGTEAFCARLPNLDATSIFGTRFGVRGGLRSRALEVPRADDGSCDAGFLDTLNQALDLILEQRPDLVLYQASADSHCDDPKSRLKLRPETLIQRDSQVYRALRWARVPVLTTLAGGYQAPERVAALYLRTIEAAATTR